MLGSSTPPLLRKMMETVVGDLVVLRDRISEPKSGLMVASGFPDHSAAIAAARQMNEVADWFGVLKARADGRNPNCIDELERIAAAHGGVLGRKSPKEGAAICAETVARYEGTKRC